MSIVASIDPNVRTRGNQTFVAFSDLDWFPIECEPQVGDRVTALWAETDLFTSGHITEIDAIRGLVYLAVDWTGFHTVDDELKDTP